MNNAMDNMEAFFTKTVTDYIGNFQRPELATLWAQVVNDNIRPYLAPLTVGRKYGGMMLWGTVIDGSLFLGILKKGIEHQTAAELLYAACPGCFEDVGVLKTSIDNYYRESFWKTNSESKEETRQIIREKLKACLPSQKGSIHVEAPLAEHAFAIAEKLVDIQFNSKSSFVRRNPEYTAYDTFRVTPAVSIETFPDQKAIANNAPSSVVSIECVDDGVSESRVEFFHSKYSPFAGRHHLIIITRVGFKSDEAERLCRAYNMGLWIVRSDGSYERILSRSVNEYAALLSARKALFGGTTVNHDVVYADGEFMTLPELLEDWGVHIKPGFILKAPYLSKADIKSIASDHLRLIGYKGYGYTVQGIERLADEFGFTWSWGQLMEHQLGICNFDENRIVISNTLYNDPHRFRFVFMHDGGHYILQKDSVGPFIHAFGESRETLLTCNFRREELRWMEWQANQYARYTLMPEEIMMNLICACYDERMLRQHRLYVDDQPCNLFAYYEVMHKMSSMANVSMQALHYRLKEMEWLVDERKPLQIGTICVPDVPW